MPAGGDAYLVKFVLHDWDDEQPIPTGNLPSFAKSQDVNTLANLGGRERTEAEYRALYAAAGFELTRTIAALGLHIIEGIPV